MALRFTMLMKAMNHMDPKDKRNEAMHAQISSQTCSTGFPGRSHISLLPAKLFFFPICLFSIN